MRIYQHKKFTSAANLPHVREEKRTRKKRGGLHKCCTLHHNKKQDAEIDKTARHKTQEKNCSMHRCMAARNHLLLYVDDVKYQKKKEKSHMGINYNNAKKRKE